MKNKITIILLALLGLSVQSCLFQEDDLFDDSSANRATASVEELKSLLTSVPNGWRMEYYAGTDYSMGGINLLCRFDEQNATLMSEIGGKEIESGVEVSSLYKVTSEESTVLTFDSFNGLLHCFSEPVLMSNTNLEGDYEFVFRRQENSKIILEGRRYHNTIVLTPLDQDVTWKDYMSKLKALEAEAPFTNYTLIIGGKEVGSAQRASRVLVCSTDTGESIEAPFIYTLDGLQLQSAATIQGKQVQHFVWNNDAQAFVCTDEGATDVTLKGIVPDGYVPYEDYLGFYYMYYLKYSNRQFTQAMTVVEIKEKVRGESFLMVGSTLEEESGDIVLTYEKNTGRLLIRQQAMELPSFPQYKGSLVVAFQGGFLPAYYGLDLGNIADYTGSEMGLVGNVETAQDGKLNISFGEYGNFFSSIAGVPATGFVVGAYNSSSFTQSNYLGYLAWYDSIQLQQN